MKNLKYSVLLISLVTASSTALAQPACVDEDGDGWGWNGSSSCQVGRTPPSAAAHQGNSAPCVDADGDGFGWNGVASCRVGSSISSQAASFTSAPNSACVDPDGDGFGWDGVASCRVGSSASATSPTSSAPSTNSACVDPDGDGFGWDGVASCRVGSSAPAPAPAQPANSGNCVDADGDGFGWNGVATCRVGATAQVPSISAGTTSSTASLPSSGTPVQRNGRLSVCKKNSYYSLCNQDGVPIQLTGMSTHGIQWSGWHTFDQYGCLTDKSMDLLAYNWKTNVIRIAMYVHRNNQGYDSNPERFIQHVNKIIQEASDRGMYAVVDYHILSNRGQGISGNPLDYLSSAENFFRRIVRDNKHRNNVLYEIANEPQGDNLTWDQIRRYGDRITQVIRQEENPNNRAVVIVGTNSWSSFGMANNGSFWDIVNNPVTDSANNLMYAFHFYANDPSHIRNGYRNALNESVNHIPVFVTEWGTQHASGSGANNFQIAQEYVDTMKNKKISWAMWNFSDSDEQSAVWESSSFCSRDNDWNNRNNLSETGRFIKGVFDSN